MFLPPVWLSLSSNMGLIICHWCPLRALFHEQVTEKMFRGVVSELESHGEVS